jgi:hypothetical protein
MWGRLLILDCSAREREAVRDGDTIREFCEGLVPSATHLPEAAGYSLEQVIETSAVTGHFRDASGDAYLDVFSCTDFDPEVAIEVVERHFSPKFILRTELIRDASAGVPHGASLSAAGAVAQAPSYSACCLGFASCMAALSVLSSTAARGWRRRSRAAAGSGLRNNASSSSSRLQVCLRRTRSLRGRVRRVAGCPNWPPLSDARRGVRRSPALPSTRGARATRRCH